MKRAVFASYLKSAAAILAGLCLGLAATAVNLRSGYGFEPLIAGPWVAWPKLGRATIDPYARAALARSGQAPLGREEGLAYVARFDSAGGELDGRCEYRVSGTPPAARFWTLALLDRSGATIVNAAGRHAWTSAEILRSDEGGAVFTIARDVRPGNWLPAGDGRPFLLELRLYDPPADIERRPDPGAFPSIEKLKCA